MGKWQILVPFTTEEENLLPDSGGENDVTYNVYSIAGNNRNLEGPKFKSAFSAPLAYNTLGGDITTYTADLALLSGQQYTFTVHFYLDIATVSSAGNIVLNVQPTGGGTSILNQTLPTASMVQGRWVQFSYLATPSTSGNYKMTLNYTIAAPLPALYQAVGWTSCWMLLRGDKRTVEYFDGNMDGCYWSPDQITGTSIRQANHPDSGTWADLETLVGSIVKQGESTGTPTINNRMVEVSQGDGSVYQDSLLAARKLTLSLWAAGDSFDELRTLRRRMLEQFPVGVPRWVGYLNDDLKDRVKAKVYYAGGAELKRGNGFVESVGIMLEAPDPYWYSDIIYGGAMVTNAIPQSVSSVYQRDPNGVWSSMGDLNGDVNVLHVGPFTGRVYAGGKFTQDNGVACLRIAYWDKLQAKWIQVANGLTNEVLCIQEVGPEYLYVGTVAGMYFRTNPGYGLAATNWALSGAATACYCLGVQWSFGRVGGVFDPRLLGSNLGGTARTVVTWPVGTGFNAVIGGAFTNINTSTVVNNIAFYTGGGLTALAGSGFNNTVYAVARKPDGTVYAGGAFTQTGATACLGIARYGVAGWSQVGNGITHSTPANLKINALQANMQGVVMGGGTFDSGPYSPGLGVSCSAFEVMGNNIGYMGFESSSFKHLTLADDGSIYAVGADTGSVSTNQAYVVNNTALGSCYPVFRCVSRNSIVRVENATTGAKIGVQGTDAVKAAELDTSLPKNQLHNVDRWHSPLYAGATYGTNPNALKLQPGINYINVYGTSQNYGGVSGIPANRLAVAWRRRHTSIDGGIVR